jgi:hypothetical protein
MVEVFKTNVTQREIADQLISALQMQFQFSRVNFDLEDCDKILRVEDNDICIKTIVGLLNYNGFECEVLN